VDRPVMTERVSTLDTVDVAARPPDRTEAGRVCRCGPALDVARPWPVRDLRLTRVAATEAVPALRRLTRRWTAESDLDEDTAEDVVLAVDEAVTNVVEHAYAGVAGAVRLQLTRWECGELTVIVEDDGTWRPPPTDPGFRGRGLSLITRLADHAHVNSTSTGTVVRMNWAAPA
jgi:anti-sigma regulatory factor (Ser/Thr protein kinase)